MTDFHLDFIEEWNAESFVPEQKHNQKCTNQTAADTYCVLLADRANHCAHANDPNWWAFTACMFAHNGGMNGDSGLSVDGEFETTVQTCASNLETYSFNDLKACYTGAEGDSIARSSAAGIPASIVHPTWMYVNGQFVGTRGPPNPTADLTNWANQVKAAICNAYTGTTPAGCNSLMAV